MITIPIEQARINNSLALLNSPSGVGQTASIYARANRTGWQGLGDTTDSYTIGAWLKFKARTDGGIVLGSNADGGGATYPFKIDIGSNKLRFSIYDGTNNPLVSSGTTIALDTWVHFFCTRNVSDDKLYIDINGVADANTTDTTTATCANTKMLGLAHDGGLTNAGDIVLLDLRIFNRALTAGEKTAIYTTGLTAADRANPADWHASLIGWWPLDRTVRDLSFNHNDFVTQNATFLADFPISVTDPITPRW